MDFCVLYDVFEGGHVLFRGCSDILLQNLFFCFFGVFAAAAAIALIIVLCWLLLML